MVEVAAAVIRQENRYLITQRKRDAMHGGQWEFPGGKRHRGESLEECLRREIQEELGVDIVVQDLVHEVLYPYPHNIVVLYFYDCSIRAGEIRPLGCQGFKWVSARDLPAYSFPPANFPLISELASLTT